MAPGQRCLQLAMEHPGHLILPSPTSPWSSHMWDARNPERAVTVTLLQPKADLVVNHSPPTSLSHHQTPQLIATLKETLK